MIFVASRHHMSYEGDNRIHPLERLALVFWSVFFSVSIVLFPSHSIQFTHRLGAVGHFYCWPLLEGPTAR